VVRGRRRKLFDVVGFEAKRKEARKNWHDAAQVRLAAAVQIKS
jgi:hypothetical protein